MRSQIIGLTVAAGLLLAAASAGGEQPGPLPFDNCRFVPAAARTLEVQDEYWSTDLELANTGATSTRISVTLLDRGEDNRGARAAILDGELAPGASRLVEDVAATVLPVLWRDWLGGLVVCSEQPGLELVARAYRRAAGGTVGQGLPALDLGEAIGPGAVGHLLGLREDADYRTNVGLLNPTPTALRVTLRLVADDGTLALVILYDLRPLSQVQLNHFLDRYPAVGLDHARLEIISPEGPVFAYASLVDNRTNDPTSVLPTVAAAD